MERTLADSLRPSPEELREEAWALLEQSRRASDRQVRRELAARAFELAQLSAQLDMDQLERQGKPGAADVSAR